MTTVQNLLNVLGWSRDHAASRIGVTRTQMRYWANGTNTRGNPSIAPQWVEDRLRDYINAMDKVHATIAKD